MGCGSSTDLIADGSGPQHWHRHGHSIDRPASLPTPRALSPQRRPFVRPVPRPTAPDSSAPVPAPAERPVIATPRSVERPTAAVVSDTMSLSALMQRQHSRSSMRCQSMTSGGSDRAHSLSSHQSPFTSPAMRSASPPSPPPKVMESVALKPLHVAFADEGPVVPRNPLLV